ncbi:hypothetical protein RA19_19260 [Leisingera sp. ANG-M1]|uniref:LysR family transcriptional regulator n=1 Tax=Leisingera sp. ANG-M1 TaxID=1577895 RepID=UPI00057FA548|nr:LysR family transcriptional regulator [Leisingera sp. ANG-M1]KIC08593.1 hypothetical protein RA19_19260 [Leisingera sp. ANG-M1]
MNEKQLRAFKLAIETGTLAQAARLMHVSAPAVSQMLTALEEELGFSLLHRRQGQVTPTPHGLYFLRAAEQAVSALESARETGQMLRTNPLGQIRVSVSAGMSLRIVPRVVARFRQDYPACQVSVQARTSPRTLDLVLHQVADIGIVDAPFQEGRGDGISFRIPLGCVFREDHPLAALETVTPADAAPYQLVTLSGNLKPTQSLLAAFGEAGLAPSLAAECNLFSSVIATALYSDLVGFAPGQSESHTMDLPDMAFRPFEPPVFYECTVLESEAKDLVTERKRFMQLLLEELSKEYGPPVPEL